MDWKIGGSRKALKGEIVVPPDKSISHRAVMFGAIASGECKINNFLSGEDCLSTLNAFVSMGVDIKREKLSVIVKGKGLKGLRAPSEDLYLGNSGTSMRIITGILAGQGFDVCLRGDASLAGRPMERILGPLGRMGAKIDSRGGYPPLCIYGKKGPLLPMQYDMPIASAQVKSCILSAGMYAEGRTTVTERFLSRDHTERMLEFFSADIERKGPAVSIGGGRELVPRDVDVPGDISSAAFFIVAALLRDGSDVTLKNVGLNPTRTGILEVLKRMGARIEVFNMTDGLEPCGNIRIVSSGLKGTRVRPEEIPSLIDEVPILMLAACMAEGRTEIQGASELKFKESDRIKSMQENLRAVGIAVTEEKDVIVIEGKKRGIVPSVVRSFGDHRIAMTMAVASLFSDKGLTVEDVDCVNTSYPGFYVDLMKISGR
ncbi:MAG: 3-phosphoshikimate 1-carboxyvinyltransferase [Candidatus Omnitrophota bacterium]|nr:3-phosphoshikimate 1-carboxyvinyltransferase [Candidatus Omnitrophota bacterium]